ncbi:hypothetical protein ACFPYI_21400 [Halomarina salina]|uniref:Uncharacterized protein n=1 Tax=Halomarina salina TaxID=1872699 RepID=A0ABD5RTZ1_9EURY|nr:hypothetical protein [Halomarina salina]
MSREDTTLLDDIDRTETELESLVEELWTGGIVTDDDAAEFSHRVETIAAELRACVEYAEDGPLANDEN